MIAKNKSDRTGDAGGRGRGRGRGLEGKSAGGRGGYGAGSPSSTGESWVGTRDGECEVQENSIHDKSLGEKAVGLTCKVISDEQTAEMCFPAGKTTSQDHHDSMDCDVFMTWLEKRLWKTFREKFD